MGSFKLKFLTGYLFLFDLFIIGLILIGFWPHMTPGLSDGTYPYMDNVRFVIGGSAFGGLLGGIAMTMFDEDTHGK